MQHIIVEVINSHTVPVPESQHAKFHSVQLRLLPSPVGSSGSAYGHNKRSLYSLRSLLRHVSIHSKSQVRNCRVGIVQSASQLSR
jgi:hypothetical protein